MKNILQKRLAAVFLIAVLILSCTACQSKDDEIYDALVNKESAVSTESTVSVESEPPASMPEMTVNEDLKADLVLRTYDYPDQVEMWNTYIEGFQEYYPNINITLSTSDSLINNEAYRSHVTVEMFSGEAGDLLDMSFLPGPRYAASGLLLEIGSLLEETPDFSWDNYYTNVFDAVRYDGGLYYVPYEMDLFGVRLKKPVTDQLGFQEEGRTTLPIPEMLELLRQANELPGLPDKFYEESGGWRGITDWFELSSYVKEGEKSASFTSEEFINYLKQLKGLPFDPNMQYGAAGGDQVELAASQFYCFISLQTVGKTCADLYLESNESDQVTRYFLTETSLGGKTFSANSIAVTSACKNPEAAAAFVRFLLDTDMKMDYRDSGELSWLFPVNRPVNRKILTQSFGAGHEDAVEDMDNWCGQVDTLMLLNRNGELFDILEEIMKEYMNDLTTAEECAQKLQERAWIYLNE